MPLQISISQLMRRNIESSAYIKFDTNAAYEQGGRADAAYFKIQY